MAYTTIQTPQLFRQACCNYETKIKTNNAIQKDSPRAPFPRRCFGEEEKAAKPILTPNIQRRAVLLRDAGNQDQNCALRKRKET